MKRLVGIDYGRRRLGLAITDPVGITVQGCPTLKVSGFEDTLAQLVTFLAEQDVSLVVIGLPLNMDGTRGEMAEEVERLGKALGERASIDIRYWDERLTSEGAKQMLNAGGVKADRSAGDVDRVAAALMLESYLQANPVR